MNCCFVRSDLIAQSRTSNWVSHGIEKKRFSNLSVAQRRKSAQVWHECFLAVNAAVLHRVVANVSWALACIVDWSCYSIPPSFSGVYYMTFCTSDWKGLSVCNKMKQNKIKLQKCSFCCIAVYANHCNRKQVIGEFAHCRLHLRRLRDLTDELSCIGVIGENWS